MIIEMQIRASQFAAGFRERMRRELSCRPLDFNIGTEAFMATSFDIGNTLFRHGAQPTAVACVRGLHLLDQHKVNHRALQLVQTLHANVCSRNNLIAANAAPCPTFQLHLDLIFEIAMDSCTWWSDLVFTFVGVDGLSPNMELVQAITAQMAPTRTPLPFAQMLSALPGIGSPTIINAQIVLSQGRQTIAIRGETWDPAALNEGRDTMRGVAYWQTFLNNTFVERLNAGGQARDWSIFMEKGFIVAPLRDALEASLKDSSDLRLHGGVSASWENHGGTPRINIDFNADAISACRCFTKKIDVNADNSISMDLSVPKANVMRQDAYIDVDPDFWDAACCSITGAFFWPLVGAELLADDQIDWWLYPVGIVVWYFCPFVLFGVAMYKALNPEDAIKPKGGLTKDPDDDSHWIQETPSPMQPTDFGTPTLLHAAAVDDAQLLQASGMMLSGSLTIEAAKPTGVLKVLDFQPFEYHITGGCSQMHAAITAFIGLVNDPEFIPIDLCDVRVLDDLLGVFSRIHPPRWSHNSGTITYDIGWVPPAYFDNDNPYPCRLLIITRSGVRLLTLGVLGKATDADNERIRGELFKAISQCYAKSDPFYHGSRLNPEWIPDPPFGELVTHLWQVRVAGLDPGEQLTVTGARNTRIGIATANREGLALITAMTTPAAALSELGVRRQRAVGRGVAMVARSTGADAANPRDDAALEKLARKFLAAYRRGVRAPFGANEKRGIIIRQTLLIERGRLWFPSPVQRAQMFTRDRVRMLTVTTDDGVVDFDLRDRGRPMSVAAYRHEGLRGQIRRGDDVLAFGARGFVRLARRAGVPEEIQPRCDRREVHAAVPMPGGVAALENGRVHLYDDDLCPVGQLDRDEATSLVGLDDFLVVGSTRGFDVYQATAESPALVASVELAGTQTVHAVPGMGGGRFLYVAERSGGRLFDLTDAREPHEVMRMEGSAWFLDGSHQGTTIVLPSADRTQVIVYDASTSVVI
jgi:hypothetical protein